MYFEIFSLCKALLNYYEFLTSHIRIIEVDVRFGGILRCDLILIFNLLQSYASLFQNSAQNYARIFVVSLERFDGIL